MGPRTPRPHRQMDQSGSVLPRLPASASRAEAVRRRNGNGKVHLGIDVGAAEVADAAPPMEAPTPKLEGLRPREKQARRATVAAPRLGATRDQSPAPDRRSVAPDC